MNITDSTCQTCGTKIDLVRSDGVCAVCLFGDAMDQEVNEMFGGHELQGVLARGGMGVVYRAMQREPRREVALKTLRGAELDSLEAQTRFRDEARTMAGLDHPGILPIHQFGQQDGVLFFTMKLAIGGSLAERLADYAGKWRKVAELIASVADAVQFAHEHGVLHRDIKPANILFDEEDHAFVSDFGLAKLAENADGGFTGSAAMLGTPHYMAPEIAAHGLRAATTATDVWSLGVMLYELLAQARPFKSDSVPALMREIAEREPEVLAQSVPSDLRVIASKALTKDPARRYTSAHALADDLRSWLEGRPIAARPTPAGERVWLWIKRNPALAAVSVLAVVAVGAAITSLAWGLDRAKQETKNVSAARDESQRQLRDALLERARSARMAGLQGWRSAGLKALGQAAAIRSDEGVISEAIAHLVGIDVEVSAVRPAVGGSNGMEKIGANADFTQFAGFSIQNGELTFADAQGERHGGTLKVPLSKSDAGNFHLVNCVFNAPGDRLVLERENFGGGGGGVALVDAKARRVVRVWETAGFAGFGDGGRVIGVFVDRLRLSVCSAEDGRQICELTTSGLGWHVGKLHPAIGNDLVLLGRSKYSEPKPMIEVWNWKLSRMIRQISVADMVTSLDWSGDLVAASYKNGSSGTVWNLRNNQATAFSGEASSLAPYVSFVGSKPWVSLISRAKGAGQILEPRTGRRLLTCASDGPPLLLSASGDRILLAYGKLGELRTSGAVETVDLSGVTNTWSGMDRSPDGRWWLLHNGPGIPVIVDSSTKQVVAFAPRTTIGSCFLADSKHIAVFESGSETSGKFVIHSMEIQEGELKTKPIKDLNSGFELRGARVVPSSDRRVIACAGLGSIKLYEPLDGEFLRFGEVPTLSYSAVLVFMGREEMLLGGQGAAFTRFNWRTGVRDVVCFDDSKPGQPAQINSSLKPCPEGRFASGRKHRNACVLDLQSKRTVWTSPEVMTDFSNMGGPVDAWTPDGEYYAFVNHHSSVVLMRTDTWERVAILSGRGTDSICALDFGPDGCSLAMLRYSGSLEFWNLQTLRKELASQGIAFQCPKPSPLVPYQISGPVKPVTLPPLAPSSTATKK